MIWRFKSNKVRVGGGIRTVHYKPDGSIFLAVGDNWSETELVPDAPLPAPKNTPPVAVSDAQILIVEPRK